MTHNPHPTREQADALFSALDGLLAVHDLPTSDGSRRRVPADEFMLMHLEPGGRAGFKHRVTRNYVFLSPIGGGEYLLRVPQTRQAFQRGTFDGYN